MLQLVVYRQGQGENKLRTHALCTDHIDILIVCRNNILYNGKPQASALFVLSPGQIGLVKPLPYFMNAVLGDSDSAVLHRHKYFVIALRSLNGDGRAVGAELDGIVNEVVQYLLNLAHISSYEKGFLCQDQLKGDALLHTGSFKGKGSIFDNGVKIKAGHVENGLAVRAVFIQLQHTLGQLI